MRSPTVAYAWSFGALVAAVVLRWLLAPVLGGDLPFVTLFGATAAAVWMCGYRPAIVVALLGYLAAEYLFIEPRGLLGLTASAEWVGLAAYLFTSALIVGFGEAMRVSQGRARQRHETLQVTRRSIGDAVITTDVDGDFSAQRRVDTERVQQLQAARLLAAIVESSDDAIVSKSLDGVIQSWNAAAERLFGHAAQEAIGRHISLIIPPGRRAEEERIVASLRVGVRIEHFETERMTSDGRLIPVSLTISPIKDEAGNVVGASMIARDITERKRAEGELRRLAADLAAADRRKEDFLAMLSHELRNPLAPLANMLQVMKRAGSDATTLRRARETMERQLTQLVRLVDDLLDLNRITHDRLELRQAQVELTAVLNQAIEACRPHTESAGQHLRVTAPPAPTLLFADAARLAQVFGNLLDNAAKYTSRGGSIGVDVRREGADVVVTVSDTGRGIPPDKLHSIFEMFEQVDRSLERTQGGLGIGLTLVRRLVQMHGGSVEAHSAGEGQGSEFVVRLPLMNGLAQPTAPRAAAAEPPPARRILIVDDNIDAAESLAMLLQMTGHETATAHDGATALELIERDRPEVVLLDIGLPRFNGLEVCRRARVQPWGADVVFIALSGWGKEDDMRRSREAGFDGHLVKPADLGELRKLIAAAPVTRGVGPGIGGVPVGGDWRRQGA